MTRMRAPAFLLLLATSTIEAAQWLAVNVDGTAVWSSPSGVEAGAWTYATTLPFAYQDSSMALMARGGKGVTCFKDIQLVPLVAPPPTALLTYVWTGNLTLGGVSVADMTTAWVSSAMAAFTGLPPSSVYAAPAYEFSDAACTAQFTVVARTPEQRTSLITALTATADASSSTSTDSYDTADAQVPARNIGPALTAFLGRLLGGITFAAVSDLSEALGTGNDLPPTPPAPPYPTLPPAPTAPNSSAATVGCALVGGPETSFRGSVSDVQLYSYALSRQCAASLVANSTGGCTAAPPPPPLPLPPPPREAGVVMNTDDATIPGRACGLSSPANITMSGLGACVYSSAAAVALCRAAISVAAFPANAAPVTKNMVGLSDGSNVSMPFTGAPGTYAVSWRQTMQAPLSWSQSAPTVVVSVGTRTAYMARAAADSVCSMKGELSCQVVVGVGDKVTIAVYGRSIYIDSVTLLPAPVAGAPSCRAAAPPPPAAPPTAPPHPPVVRKREPPPPPLPPAFDPDHLQPGSMVQHGVVVAPITSIPLGVVTAVRMVGMSGASALVPLLTLIVFEAPASVQVPPDAAVSTGATPTLGAGFCGLGSPGARAIALHTATEARALLLAMADGTLPFNVTDWGVMDALSAALTTAALNAPGVPPYSAGLLVPSPSGSVWQATDSSGDITITLLQADNSLVGSSLRMCAVATATPKLRRRLVQAPSGIASDSGSIAMSAAPSPPPPPSPAPPPPIYVDFSTLTYRGADTDYVFDTNPFRCQPATVDVFANESLVVVKVTSYSEVTGDASGVVLNYGRSEFTYATFNPLLAALQPWTNGNELDTSRAFDAMNATDDPHRFDGTCSLSAAELLLPTVRTITNAPPPDTGWAPGMTTSDLKGITPQAAGCAYPVYAQRADGSYAQASGSPADAPDEHLFWSASANRSPSWAVRQTTCGASTSDQCSPTRPFAFHAPPGATGVVACTLRTEAILVMPLTQFMTNVAVETSPLGGSSVRTFQWSLSTVEVASSSAVNASMGVDVYNWRVTHAPYSMSVSPGGAVVESLPVGTLAPPIIISVMASGGVGGPTMTRALPDGSVRIVWQTHAYVMQPPNSSSVTLLDNATMADAPAYSPTWTAKGYSATCAPWVWVDEVQPGPSGSAASTISCAQPGCAPQPQGTLPAALLTGFTQAAAESAAMWLQYSMNIVCVVDTAPVDDSSPINVPGADISVRYSLTTDGYQARGGGDPSPKAVCFPGGGQALPRPPPKSASRNN